MNYYQKKLAYPIMILVILFLIPFSSMGQIQVSDVKNYQPDDDYPRKGFMKIGDEEYYIEQGNVGTKVWYVDNNELKFVHELKFRPTDSNINLNTHHSYDNNSYWVYDGSILFEFYAHYIYLVDIVKGEVVEIIDLRPHSFNHPSSFYFGKNYYYFEVFSSSGWRGKVRYDRNSKRMEIMSFSGIFADSKLYTWNHEGFTYLDLETNKTDKIKLDWNIQNIKNLIQVHSDPNIHFVFQDNNHVYLLLADNTIDTLACSIPTDNVIKHYSNKRIIYGSTDENEEYYHYCIKNMDTCEDVLCEKFNLNSDKNYIRFRDTKNLYADYFLIYEHREVPEKSKYFYYDIKNDLKKEIENIDNGVSIFNTLRKNESFYFATSQRINNKSVDRLYVLNLETAETIPLIENENRNPTTIILGETTDKENIHVSYQYESGYSLLQINEKEHNIKEITQNDIIKNIGIQPNILSQLWADNKYFAATCDAVYVIEEQKSSTIINMNPHRCKVSDFLRKDDDIYILTGTEGSYFILKININTLNHTILDLPETFQIGETKAISNHILVNYANRDLPSASPGYFDFKVNKYIPIDSLGLPTGRILQVSSSNILYWAYTLYLIDPVKNRIIPTNIPLNLPHEVVPDNKGGFYLNANNKFSYLNKDGELSLLIDNFNYKYIRSGKDFSNDRLSFAFYNDKEVVIVIIKNGVVHKKARSIDNSFYAPSFFWYESEVFSFIETLNGQSCNLFYFKDDTEPQLISTKNRNERTILMMENQDHVVFIHKGRNHNFDKFDFKTQNFSRALTYESGFSSLYGPAYPISDKEFLISFADGTHGREPWIYNIDTHEFEILADIRTGFLSSSISNMTTHPHTGDVYFTATRTEGDRQLFKILNPSVSTENIYSYQPNPFTLYPVPASDFIIIDSDLDNISITGVGGTTPLNIKNYKKGDFIKLKGLSNGVYFLASTLNGQSLKARSFIVSR